MGISEIPGNLGEIFTQKDENVEEKVITYASRQLLKHQKNYQPLFSGDASHDVGHRAL